MQAVRPHGEKWIVERGACALLLSILLGACAPLGLTTAPTAAPTSSVAAPAAASTAEPSQSVANSAEPAPRPYRPADLPEVSLGQVPAGWSVAGDGWKHYSVTRDMAVARAGKASMRITAEPNMTLQWPNPWRPWVAALQAMDAKPWLGKRVRMSAWVKVEGFLFSGIWMRVNSQERLLQFDNMQNRILNGTGEWTRFDVVLDVPPNSAVIIFGTLLHGGGQMWVDDFEFHEVDGDIPSTNLLTFAELLKDSRRTLVPDHPQANERRPTALPYPKPRNLDFED